MIAIYLYMNIFHVSSDKKINLSKIKPDKHERSPTEVTRTEYKYWRREFISLTILVLSLL